MKPLKSKKLQEHYKKVSHREFRLADQIKQDIAEILLQEVRDPRINNVTITDVEVSGDLSTAKIFFSIYPSSEEKITEVKLGLKAARGFLRARLGKVLKIYRTPEISFFYDKSLSEGQALSDLIQSANQGVFKPSE